MATPAAQPDLPIGLPTYRGAPPQRIAGAVVRTPTMLSRALSERTGATVWVKFENLQHTGAYKERGALNKLLLMERGDARARRDRGLGRQSQPGGRLSCRRLGVPATIVMPASTPTIKVSQTESHGAEVILHGEMFDEAYAEALRLADERGAHLRPSVRRFRGDGGAGDGRARAARRRARRSTRWSCRSAAAA